MVASPSLRDDDETKPMRFRGVPWDLELTPKGRVKMTYTPEKLTWNPKSWRFGSDDFPLQHG